MGQIYENSETKRFVLNILYPGPEMDSYTVEYELFPTGRTLLMSVFHHGLPLDAAELASAAATPFVKEVYQKIREAIADDAKNENEVIKKAFGNFPDMGKALNSFCKIQNKKKQNDTI